MLILRCVLECATPLHCGGGTDAVQDQPVERDAFGYWRLPGTSIAGALRALAASQDKVMAERLFGWQDGEKPNPSLVWCEDALLLDYDHVPVLDKVLREQTPLLAADNVPFVRDHVKLGLETGAAEKGAKFDMEIVPAGARFLFEIRCDGWDKPLRTDEKDFFCGLVSRILAGRLSFGAKSSLGYGRYNIVSYSFIKLDLTNRKDMADWLGLDPFALSLDCGTPVQVERADASDGTGDLAGWLEIPLAADGPILIGGGSPDRKDTKDKKEERISEADILFALTPRLRYQTPKSPGGLEWLPVLPASALKGVLRHGVYNVLRGLGVGSEESEAMLDGIFGYVKGDSARMGKIALEDCALICQNENPLYQFEQHVAIDRFTQAALEGALFSEEPWWNQGGRVLLRLYAGNLAGHEAALLFHALFDLFDGSIAIGSGVNRGNGRLILPGWRDNPAGALDALTGDMAWKGRRIFTTAGNAAAALKELAPEWDDSLETACLSAGLAND